MSKLLKAFIALAIVMTTTRPAAVWAMLQKPVKESIVFDILKHEDWDELQRLEELKKVIKKYPGFVNAMADDGTSAFSWACSNFDLKIVEFLIEHNADINERSFGLTELQMAASVGHKKLVRLLLEKGSSKGLSINITTLWRPGYEATALDLAIERGHKEIAELLIKYGAKKACVINSAWAKMLEQYHQYKKEHKRPANTNSNNYILRKIINTPYQTEAKKIRDLKTVLRALITEVDAVDGSGQTAVDYAVMHRNPKVLALLIAAGANIKKINPTTEDTILHEVAPFADTAKLEILNILIKNGADVNKKNCNGLTALHLAVMFNNLEGAKLLVENGNAKLDEKDDWGFTALEIAKKKGFPQMFDYLSTINPTNSNLNIFTTPNGLTNTNLCATMGNLSITKK